MSQEVIVNGILGPWPDLFEATQVNGDGKFEYRARIYLDPQTDWNSVNAAIQEAITAKFGNSVPPNLELPFHPADEDGFPGQFYINAKANPNYPPQVVDQNVNKIMDRSIIFAGCRIAANVRFFGYDQKGNKGVSVGLNHVMLVDNVNVTRLDNRKDAKQVFKPIAGAPAERAPTQFSQPQQQQAPFSGQPAQTMGAPAGNGAFVQGAAPAGAGSPVPTGAPGTTPQGQGYGAPAGQPGNGFAPTQGAPGQPYAAPAGQPAGAVPAAGYPSDPNQVPPGGWPYQR